MGEETSNKQADTPKSKKKPKKKKVSLISLLHVLTMGVKLC